MNESTGNDGPSDGLSGGLPDRPSERPSGGPDALPELLELDLEALRTLDHPVLRDVVAELRERAEQPREMLWGFTNAF
ncbi:FxSxx-COOH cyclophane-containing RiPP peptide [Streptomyces sp. NPDC014734]|uniref:FxSxx-COOH cyclophane-containing RiPP peptide n=1 Tax=Streptomyces sp. NPDC014734 TaxID=3364886 RepID=UPI0036F54692